MRRLAIDCTTFPGTCLANHHPSLIRPKERLCEIGMNEDGMLLVCWYDERLKNLKRDLTPEQMFQLGEIMGGAFYAFLTEVYGGKQ